MRILITGATGFIGSHLVRACLAQHHQVVTCVHRTKQKDDNSENIEIVHCDFTHDHQIHDWVPRLQGVDAVINAVGIIRETRSKTFSALHCDTPKALFQACETVGVKKVIQISALGADDQAISQYHLTKKAADDYLGTLNLNWSIVMPSIVYGSGAKSMTFFKAMAALPIVPLINQGEQAIQPVHISDFTRVILMLLENSQDDCQRHNLVGPAPITMKELFANLRLWLGLKPAMMLPVPYGVSLRFAQLTGFLGDAPVTPQSIQMLRRGNTASVEPFIRSFGFRPKAFSEVLQQQPALEADQWHARLYFLKPLLRLSIALLWIITGLVSAFFYPLSSSFELLSRLGITGIVAPISLYTAAGINLALGFATLLNFRIQLVATLQILLILTYSALISIGLPEYWIHPYGPVLKNIPIIVATLILISLETPKWKC